MKISIVFLIGVLGAFCLQALSTQEMAAQAVSVPSTLDVAVTYDLQPTAATTSNSFLMQGGSVQAQGRFWRGLGVVADVAGAHSANMHNSGVGLDLVTAAFGPRYTQRLRRKKIDVYGQFLVGEVWGMNSVFPSSSGARSDANNLAWLAGGGVNHPVNRHVSWRVLEANWLYTHLPNATGQSEHSIRLGTGLIIRIP